MKSVQEKKLGHFKLAQVKVKKSSLRDVWDSLMNKIIVFFSVFRFFDFVYIQFKYADIFMLII